MRSPWTWLALVYALLSGALLAVPITQDLHYEFSAAVALAASLASGITSGFDRRTYPSLAERSYHHLARAIGLSLLPLLIWLLRAVFVHTCGLGDGILWYLTLVPAASAISVVLAATVTLVLHRPWLRALVVVFLWSVSLIRGGYEAYVEPHIFLYVWQIGYYPGASWDPEMPITATLLLYRLGHVVIATALLGVVLQLDRDRTQPGSVSITALIALAAAVAVGAILLLPHRADLGLTRTDAWLGAELGDSLSTRHATIYYDASTTDSLSLWRAEHYTDFYIEELGAELAISPSGIPPVTIYLYSSPSEQKRLTGTASASFTKPWRRTIHQTFARIDGTLDHELAHVLLAADGDPLLGISLSQALLEGSAVALEHRYDPARLHAEARTAYHFELAPPLESIVGYTGFSSVRASLGYMLAGSFSRWLIDQHGPDRFREAYASGALERVYGVTLEELAAEHLAFLRRIDPPPADARATALYRYGGGSFFAQKCLRRIGALNAEGYDRLAEGRYAAAFDAFSRSMSEGTSYSARAGVLATLSALGRHRQLLDSVRTYALDTASYPLLPYLVEQGDAHWALGRPTDAVRLYDSVAKLDITPGLWLRARLRMYFLAGRGATSDSLSGMMREYFTRPMRLVQRADLLRRAADVAIEPATRAILLLLYASSIASELPFTAIEAAAGAVEGLDTSQLDRSERALLGELAWSLSDPLLYVASTHRHRGDVAGWRKLRELAIGSLTDELGSASTLEARRRKLHSFEAYLRKL